MSGAIVVKLALLILGVILGRAWRRQADHLRGWDEGFKFGRRHGRELAARDLEARALAAREAEEALQAFERGHL